MLLDIHVPGGCAIPDTSKLVISGAVGKVDVSSSDGNDGEGAELLRMIVIPLGPTEYPYPCGTPTIGVDVTTT